MNKFLTFSLASTVLLASAGQATAATFKIDDFTASSTTSSTGGLVSDSLSDGGILGGERAIKLNHTGGSGNLTAETKQCTDVVPPLECMTFSGESGVRGELSILYGANSTPGLDVTAGGFNDAFRLAVQFSDFPTDLDVIVTDTLGNSANFTGQTPPLITFGGSGTSELDISFDDFTGGTVDFSSLDTLEFSFTNQQAATDLEFSLVATENINFDNDPAPDPDPTPDPNSVPEPTSLISLISLFGFGIFLDWRKKQTLN